MTSLPRIAERFLNSQLMIEPSKAAAIATVLGARIVEGGIVFNGPVAVGHIAFGDGRPSEQMGVLSESLGRRYGGEVLTMVGPVAVIAIEGSLVHKGGWLNAYSGMTSYEGIQAQVARATRDARVKGVVFEVDSFGGEVAGAFETANMIAELSRSKPTIAILTDFALSAGYLLAAATRQIVLPETGAVGSIGVIALHVDYSRAIEDEGMRVTVLTSGSHKDDASPFKPLGDAVAADWQAGLDATRDLFASRVAQYRGKRLTKAAALATEAQSYKGNAAVAAGLADGVVSPKEAFDLFVDMVSRNAR